MIKKSILTFCAEFLLLAQNLLAVQITASAMEPSSYRNQHFISVHFVKEPLPDVLHELTRKVKVGISYQTKVVPKKMVTFQAENASIYTVLDAVLAGTDLQAILSKDRKVILIKKKPRQQVIYQSTITGTVTDAGTGEALPGVNILVIGTNTGTTTDGNGKYKLSVESMQDTLRFSFIGYKVRKIPIKGKSTINVALKSTTTGLNEMVVVGFGEQSKRNIVGSVASVDTAQMASASANMSVDQVLQGKIAGVQVTSSSGMLGAPVSVRVRGSTSISSSNQPLYVVDGVPINQTKLGQGLASSGQEGGINPLVNLNPSDIKSIEVLKDASAAAVYGSRGANGVVLITTKSGQAGKTQINLSVSQGFLEPTKQYDMLTGPEYARMFNYKVGKPIFGTTYPAPDQVPNTNWLDLVTHTGSLQKYQASVSGGDQQTQFFISGSYNNSEGFAQPNQLQKYNLMAKVDQSFNDKLRISLKIAPSRSVNSRINTNNSISSPYSLGPLSAPVIPAYYPNGEINDAANASRAPTNSFSAFKGTPLSNKLGLDYKSIITEINSNAQLTYDFIPQLSFKTQFSTNFIQTYEKFKQATYTTGGYPNGAGSGYNGQLLNWSWRNTLTYTNDWKDNSLTVLLGATFQETEQTQINVNGNTFLSNQLKNLNSAASITGGGGSGKSYAFQNNVARITYSYKDRYLLTLTGSFNGSSRFGKNNRYGFFPSIAGGWIISDESFVHAEALSFLKLRASYGETGNANINDYESLPLFSTDAIYAGQTGSQLFQLSKPNLSWESTKQFDVGLQYGFFDDRINGSMSYYLKKTNDLLIPLSVSATNGFTSILRNTGSVRNSGLEFSVNANIFASSSFNWSVNANIATLENEVVSLPVKITGTQVAQVGQPLGAFFLREYKGVDSKNGDAIYADGKGGTTSNYNAAPRKILGDPNPDLTGGFGTRLNFKGFDASINFQFSQGNDIYWSTGGYIATNLATSFNQISSQLDYWTPDNTDASVPEPRTVGNGNETSTRYLLDGSYLRLKNATIGYTISKQFINGNKLRIYVQGTNLLTFTNYVGLDPEATSVGSGSSLSAGSVFFTLPQSKTFIFGIELRL